MLFDIMTRPGDTPKSQLSFEPSELLCIGSPVGALATIDPHFGRGMRSTRAENDGARDAQLSRKRWCVHFRRAMGIYEGRFAPKVQNLQYISSK